MNTFKYHFLDFRKYFLLYVIASLSASCVSNTKNNLSPEEKLIYKTCDYLWQQQKADGSWRSEVHGLLKGGQAYTPFILSVLLEIPDSIYPKPVEKIEKSVQFIRKNLETSHLSQTNQLILEYPVYSAAFSLKVLVKWGNEKDKPLINKVLDYLIKQQFTEARGILPEHSAYGSWGFGETHLPKGEVGHADLSNTRRVLEALRLAKYSESATYEKVKIFLNFVQKHPSDTRLQPEIRENETQLKRFYDGGFYYSPAVLGANKAKQSLGNQDFQPYYRSYATATCDGVLALLLVGEGQDSEKVTAAKNWLLKHPNLNYSEGIPTDDPDQWHTVMFFYHLSVRAEAYKALKIKGLWQKEMLKILTSKQQKNGSFSNPLGARNKENDPLLGSTLALLALVNCVGV